MEKVAAFHELNYKKKVEVLAQVPGVVTLMGAFSDFCNGYCIAGTGALGLRVAVSARDDNLVRVYDATKSDKKHFNLNSLKYRKEDRWANYVKAVFSILSEEGVTFPHGFDITLKGALLFCDQLTVSSAVIMGCLMAVDSALSLSLGKKDLIRLSYRAATAYCSVPIRFRDLVTLLYAQKGKVLYFDLQSVSYELIDWPFTGSQYGMILDPSLPPQILREELEEKRIDARLCCKELKKRLPSDYKLRNYPVKDLKSHIIKDLDEHVRHTCEYVITESQIVQKGCSAIKEKKARSFGRYLNDLYIGMRDVFDVTCPEVDWLIKRAGEADGVYGASYVSNGASGSIFMILEEDGEAAIKSCMDEFKRIFDFTPETRPFNPGGPATVLKDFDENTAGQ